MLSILQCYIGMFSARKMNVNHQSFNFQWWQSGDKLSTSNN